MLYKRLYHVLCVALVVFFSASLCVADPTLDDFWSGTAKWQKDASNVGASFNMHFASMIWEGSQIWGYYNYVYWSGANPIGYGVGRATSSDGLNWTNNGVVLPTGGTPRWAWNAQPAPMYHLTGSAYGASEWQCRIAYDAAGYMSYGPYTTSVAKGKMEANFIFLIDTISGNNDTVLYVDVYDGTTSSVLASRAITRNQFIAANTYQGFHLNFTVPDWNHYLQFRTVWYDNANIRQQAVSVAEGSYPHWDSYDASFPGICKVDGVYYLVYEGADGSSNHPGDIGLAMSSDGLTFGRMTEPYNPILTHNASGWESFNIGTPSLYYEGSTWYLYYHGFNNTLCQIGDATGSSTAFHK